MDKGERLMALELAKRAIGMNQPCKHLEPFEQAKVCQALLAVERLLRECETTLSHAHIFIYTREKMHTDGRLLYEKLLREIREGNPQCPEK